MTTSTRPTTATAQETPLLSDIQVRALVRLPDRRTRHGLRNAALLAILVGGGLRIAEATGLRLQDIERGPRGTVVLRFKTLKRRDGSKRAVVLGRRFARPVLDYLATTDLTFWLWPGRGGRDHLDVRSARRTVKGYLERLGRPDFRVHDLRHQCTTMLLRASAGNSWGVAKALGWSNIRQLEATYGHWLDRDAHLLAQQLDDHLARGGRPRKAVA
jgi:integrase